MASALMPLALAGAFFLLAVAATIDVVRDNLPTPLPKELSPRARRAMAWLWPLLFVALGFLSAMGGLFGTPPFIAAADWPWTVLCAGLFLIAGILQIFRSLRASRTSQRLQS
jgi:hypothetical protein